jgi:hypothetical protein
MPEGSWEVIWQHTATADAGQAGPEARQQVAADPQVAEALDLLRGLGLDAGGAALDTALAHGAATMQALESAGGEFGRFLLRSTRRLDGPPAWDGRALETVP